MTFMKGGMLFHDSYGAYMTTAVLGWEEAAVFYEPLTEGNAPWFLILLFPGLSQASRGLVVVILIW